MKKIVLLDTSISSINQGDEIINISIQKNWPELFENNYIYRLASHSSMFTNIQCIFLKKKLSLIKNSDYKFLCGTNALYTNMLRPKPNWNINPINSDIVKGTVCIGVGMGKNSEYINLYTKNLFNKVLSHNFIHSTRDEKTKLFLEELGFKAVNTGCPTMWGLTSDLCEKIPHTKSNDVIFTLTYYEPDVQKDTLMIDILKRNYANLYFWPQCIRDLEYLESLDVNTKINIISPNLNSYDKILQTNIDYIGNRLHGGIFALQHMCRTIIIAIDHRAMDMNSNYSFECIERDKIDEFLENKINSSWETSIKGLDFNKIRTWKKQFDGLY